jgi:hypothetical protein
VRLALDREPGQAKAAEEEDVGARPRRPPDESILTPLSSAEAGRRSESAFGQPADQSNPLLSVSAAPVPWTGAAPRSRVDTAARVVAEPARARKQFPASPSAPAVQSPKLPRNAS